MDDTYPDLEKLGEVIAILRKAEGLSQQQLADRVGVTQPYISDIERGKADNIGIAIMGRLALVLGVRLADMLALTVKQKEEILRFDLVRKIRFLNDEPPDEVTTSYIVDIVKSLSPQGRFELLMLLTSLQYGGWFERKF